MNGRDRFEDPCFIAVDPVIKKRRNHFCLTRYIRRMLRTEFPGMTISSLAAQQIDHLLKDNLEKIGEASNLLLFTSGKTTMTPFVLAKACKLVLPNGLSRNARRMAKIALYNYYGSLE